VCFVLGASALYTAPASPGDPVVAVAPAMIAATAATIGGVMVLVTIVAIRTRRMRGPRDQLGTPVAVGTEGVVQAPLAPTGTVHLGGETWTARTREDRLVPRDTPVRLVGFDGLTALVEPIESDLPGTPPLIDPSPASPAADGP
jgi:membrane protein implicated in regulation of membrane protease activity